MSSDHPRKNSAPTPVKEIHSSGFIKDKFGSIYCKNETKYVICLNDELLSSYKLGEFIHFDANYDEQYNIYIIREAEIDVTGVRLETGTIMKGNSCVYAYNVPLMLANSRRYLENKRIGFVEDRHSEFIGKMTMSSRRKFWVILNTQPNFFPFRVLTREEITDVKMMDPDDVTAYTLVKTPSGNEDVEEVYCVNSVEL